MVEALYIHVKGIVQGVGFRPFVYREAKKHLINGWVLNATDGVHIHAEAESQLLDEFVIALAEEAPAASQVTEIELKEVPLEDFDSFEIRFSDDAEVEATTLVSPDLATCEDCVRELFDPADRRYRYPFINCTNCGPRFTIIEQLPYDRKQTSMKEFPMCPVCAKEYADPLDRRFHAQPDACFDCGPTVYFAVLTNGEMADAAAVPGTGSCRDSEGSRAELEDSARSNERSEPADAAGFRGAQSRGAAEALRTEVRGGSATPTISGTTEALADLANDQEEPPSLSSKPSAVAGVPVFWGSDREKSDEAFARAVAALRAGQIVAVKGLGGFHLACDATNADAIARLRERKRREGKAFAVMMPTLDDVRAVCEVNEAEEALLTGSQRPIVLLKKRVDVQFAKGLADDLPELGVMLPYTPVQHLLLHDFGGMLVMTSGNIHDEPIVTDDVRAMEVLAGVADAILGNNRAIRSRYDDSVVRVVTAGSAGPTLQVIRRARGFAPLPLGVPAACQPPEPADAAAAPGTGSCRDSEGSRAEHATPSEPRQSSAPGTPSLTSESECGFDSADADEQEGCLSVGTVFATGPEQKATFCLTRPGEAFVSQHIGDMENAETFDAWLEAKSIYERLFELTPELVACDKHPEYLSSKWALDAAQPLPVFEVQHHHAHIAAVMAENGLEGPVCGFAFDGTGYGEDGAIWGGEVLLANLQTFERFANFAYVPLPGGAAAIKHPLRAAYGVLWEFDLLEHPAAQRALAPLGDTAELCGQMIERGLNTPMTSSVGRLFDAASAILGVCTEPKYEGEGAILLEAAIGRTDGEVHMDYDPDAERYAIELVKNTATPDSTALDTSVVLLDPAPVFQALLDDLEEGLPIPVIARRFHDAFVDAMVMVSRLVRGAFDVDAFALGGGVFMNRYVTEHAVAALEADGCTVALSRELPPNDGCISYGQAVVALACQAASE